MVSLVPTLFNSANACAENVTKIPPDRHVALVGSKSPFHQTSTFTGNYTHTYPHTYTHAHRPTSLLQPGRGPYTHSDIPTFIYTRAHVGIHMTF